MSQASSSPNSLNGGGTAWSLCYQALLKGEGLPVALSKGEGLPGVCAIKEGKGLPKEGRGCLRELAEVCG